MSDTWPQRAKFRELVRAYVTRNGLTNDQVAPLLGLKPQSLQKYLYGNTKRPGRKVLVKAAEVEARVEASDPPIYRLSTAAMGGDTISRTAF